MPASLVSVIIAVRNGERFLAQAIESVLAQTYREMEIIVIDGQSTDGTSTIARSFPQIQYVLQSGHGVADAYNLGIQLANGEYVAFLSHDDMWMADKLEVQIGYLAAHPEVQYANARTKFFVEPGCEIPTSFRKGWLEGDQVACIMETLVARKGAFDLVGLFDDSLPTSHDVDWFARARDLGVPTIVLPQALLRKRIHASNLSLTTPGGPRELVQVMKRSIDRKRHRSDRNEDGDRPR
ncbi:MAG: glycosyltransferase [Chloroflexi bacterium]|nr:glycosyltransferase [Chloroflexota bacterium]